MGEIEFKEGAWDKARTDLQATLGLIEQLKGGFAERATWQVLLEIFQNLLHGVPWIAYPIPAGYLLFRGRIRNDVELFSNVKEMSFRPPGTVNDFGRCHRPGFSVFYGSNNLDTVLSELSPNRGDKVHVAVAQTKAADPAHVTAIGEIDYVRRYGRPLIGKHPENGNDR